MLFKKSSRATTHSFVVFDIGASSIGVGLGVGTASSTHLLWHSRIEYAFKRVTDYARYEKTMYATLLEAGMSMASEGVRIAKCDPSFDIRHASISCVLGSPWFFAGACTARRADEKVFEVTHGLVDELRASAYKSFIERPETVSWGGVMGTPELLEQYAGRVYVDGYPSNAYEHKKVQEVSINAFVAVVSQTVAEHVQDIVHRVLPNHDLTLVSSTRLLTTLVPTALGNTHQSLLIEIGGQVTSISHIKESVLTGISVVPYGTHDVLLAIAPNAVSITEAQSALTLILEKNPIVAGSKSVPKELETVGEEWRNAVQGAILTLAKGIVPPTSVVLVTHASWYPLYTELLTRPFELPGVRRSGSLAIVTLPLIEERPQPQIGTATDQRLEQFLHTLNKQSVY
jgi:hypothetical protein